MGLDSTKTILRITTLYFVFGFFWIYLTDKIVHVFTPQFESTLQTYKGWIYVLGTTIFLFVLLKSSKKMLVITKKKIDVKNEIIAKKEVENEELQKISAQLAEANKELEAFNYSVSHDLKSPLRIIHGYSEILSRKNGEQLNDDGKELLEEIKKSVIKINNLTDGLLAYSSLGKKLIIKENINMNQEFEDVIAEIKQQYADKNFKVNLELLENYYGDRAMMRSVIYNIVSNAFKYSSKQESPQINIGCYKEENQIVYYIKDNGTGFKTNDTSKLFQPFKRLHNTSEYDGSGVGLAIAARIINKHHGKIWATSESENGATFYFSLPITSKSTENFSG